MEAGLVGLPNDPGGKVWPQVGDDVPQELLVGLVGAVDSGAVGHHLHWAIGKVPGEAMVGLDEEPQLGHRELRMPGSLVVGDDLLGEAELGAAEELLEKLEGALAPVGEHEVDYSNVVRLDEDGALTLILHGPVEVPLGFEALLQLVLLRSVHRALVISSFFLL